MKKKMEQRSNYDPDLAPTNAAVNAYGRSKVAFEELLEKRWPTHHVILRSSNIVGPPSPLTGATKFLQFLEGKFRKQSTHTVRTQSAV